MPFTVKIDQNSTQQQAAVIPDATPFNDGIMSRAQAAKLSLAPSGFQSGIAVFTGAEDFVDVAFAEQFADKTYKFQLSVNSTDGTVVGVNLTNKAKSGFRIQPSAPFQGEVSWEAYVV